MVEIKFNFHRLRPGTGKHPVLGAAVTEPGAATVTVPVRRTPPAAIAGYRRWQRPIGRSRRAGDAMSGSQLDLRRWPVPVVRCLKRGTRAATVLTIRRV